MWSLKSFHFRLHRRRLIRKHSRENLKQVYFSSLAEDAFYIIREKTLERAAGTLSEQSILAICSCVVEALEEGAPEPSLFMAVRENDVLLLLCVDTYLFTCYETVLIVHFKNLDQRFASG